MEHLAVDCVFAAYPTKSWWLLTTEAATDMGALKALNTRLPTLAPCANGELRPIHLSVRLVGKLFLAGAIERVLFPRQSSESNATESEPGAVQIFALLRHPITHQPDLFRRLTFKLGVWCSVPVIVWTL